MNVKEEVKYSKSAKDFLQEKLKKSSKGIMYFAFIGGLAMLGAIDYYFGEAVSSLVGIVGIFWYLLGYLYCKTLWDKEKDMFEFYEILEKYENKHPNINT